MKKIFLTILIFLSILPVFAGSINPALYSTMQKQAYRTNYNRQTNYRIMPYWQSQANYTTRNRMYSDYKSYNNFTNSMRQYNSNIYRGRW